MQQLRHWQLNIDEDNVAWLALDRDDSSVNTINQVVLNELNEVLVHIESNGHILALIIYSGKKQGFIYGADLTQFKLTDDTHVAKDIIAQGHQVFDKLASCGIPTITVMDGLVLGGGLELALACDYRLAEVGSKLGLPEVKLGIYPGWGGTVRLPRLIGGMKALDLILTGRLIDARKAKRLGIVDSITQYRHLMRAAKIFALHPPKKHQPKWHEKLSNTTFIRPWVGKLIYRKLQAKIKPEHYPAPL